MIDHFLEEGFSEKKIGMGKIEIFWESEKDNQLQVGSRSHLTIFGLLIPVILRFQKIQLNKICSSHPVRKAIW